VLEAYDFQQKQIAGCDERLKKYVGEKPARELAGGVESAGGEGVAEQKRGRERKAQPRPLKNQPAFDLSGELRRVMGVDLTKIDGVKVMTVQNYLCRDRSGFQCLSDREAFCIMAHTGSKAGCEWGQGDQTPELQRE
jgi:hypothetical protein